MDEGDNRVRAVGDEGVDAQAEQAAGSVFGVDRPHLDAEGGLVRSVNEPAGHHAVRPDHSGTWKPA